MSMNHDCKPQGRSCMSESAFLDGVIQPKDADGAGIRLLRMDSGAVRSGVLEKATKDAAAWKPRMCALHPEAFWYSKDATPDAERRKDLRGSRNKWTCIPLTTCVQLLRWPDDGRVFLVQTGSRSYYWRAASQNEAEAWLLSIGTQCAALKERELLIEAENRIVSTEEAHTDACLDFLHSLYRLEGTLRFHDTRELLSGFLVDFFRLQPNSKTTDGVFDGQPVEDTRKGLHLGVDAQITNNRSRARQSGNDTSAAGLTLRDVQKFLKAWTSSNPEDVSAKSDFNEGFDNWKSIGEWLRVEVFPKFISSPIIQRRVAQLAASRSVMSWGVDPLRSPLLAPNNSHGGNQ